MRGFTLFLISFLVSFALAVGFLWLRSEDTIPGAVSTNLPGHCEIIQFGRGLQPVYTVALACPRMDMIRPWPLPVQQSWFEDRRERINGIQVYLEIFVKDKCLSSEMAKIE